jgi:hypothetical protein
LLAAVNEWCLAVFGFFDYGRIMRVGIFGATLVAVGV